MLAPIQEHCYCHRFLKPYLIWVLTSSGAYLTLLLLLQYCTIKLFLFSSTIAVRFRVLLQFLVGNCNRTSSSVVLLDMEGYNKAVKLIHQHRDHYITAD